MCPVESHEHIGCKADKAALPITYLESRHEGSGTVEHADEEAQRFLYQGVALGVAQVQGMPQQPPQHALELHARTRQSATHASLSFCFALSFYFAALSEMRISNT